MTEYLEIGDHPNPEDHVPRRYRHEKSNVNRCVFYSTCVMVACILFGSMVLAATIGSDAQILITDASRSLDEIKRTLHDVDELIPQVHRLIGIVEQLCNNPAFHLTCPN